MKQRSHFHAQGRRRQASRGFILVIGLLFMLVLLLLSASMFRSFTMQEKIAGNTRDKQRSFELAQSTLQYGETWLANDNAGAFVACSGAMASLAVCTSSTALATPAQESSWPGYFNYQPTAITVDAAGGLTASNDVKYQAYPKLYISYIGPGQDANSSLYQVTALGQGGSSETRSVVQSTYRLQSSVSDKGGP